MIKTLIFLLSISIATSMKATKFTELIMNPLRKKATASAFHIPLTNRATYKVEDKNGTEKPHMYNASNAEYFSKKMENASYYDRMQEFYQNKRLNKEMEQNKQVSMAKEAELNKRIALEQNIPVPYKTDNYEHLLKALQNSPKAKIITRLFENQHLTPKEQKEFMSLFSFLSNILTTENAQLPAQYVFTNNNLAVSNLASLERVIEMAKRQSKQDVNITTINAVLKNIIDVNKQNSRYKPKQIQNVLNDINANLNGPTADPFKNMFGVFGKPNNSNNASNSQPINFAKIEPNKFYLMNKKIRENLMKATNKDMKSKKDESKIIIDESKKDIQTDQNSSVADIANKEVDINNTSNRNDLIEDKDKKDIMMKDQNDKLVKSDEQKNVTIKDQNLPAIKENDKSLVLNNEKTELLAEKPKESLMNNQSDPKLVNHQTQDLKKQDDKKKYSLSANDEKSDILNKEKGEIAKVDQNSYLPADYNENKYSIANKEQSDVQLIDNNTSLTKVDENKNLTYDDKQKDLSVIREHSTALLNKIDEPKALLSQKNTSDIQKYNKESSELMKAPRENKDIAVRNKEETGIKKYGNDPSSIALNNKPVNSIQEFEKYDKKQNLPMSTPQTGSIMGAINDDKQLNAHKNLSYLSDKLLNDAYMATNSKINIDDYKDYDINRIGATGMFDKNDFGLGIKNKSSDDRSQLYEEMDQNPISNKMKSGNTKLEEDKKNMYLKKQYNNYNLPYIQPKSLPFNAFNGLSEKYLNELFAKNKYNIDVKNKLKASDIKEDSQNKNTFNENLEINKIQPNLDHHLGNPNESLPKEQKHILTNISNNDRTEIMPSTKDKMLSSNFVTQFLQLDPDVVHSIYKDNKLDKILKEDSFLRHNFIITPLFEYQYLRIPYQQKADLDLYPDNRSYMERFKDAMRFDIKEKSNMVEFIEKNHRILSTYPNYVFDLCDFKYSKQIGFSSSNVYEEDQISNNKVIARSEVAAEVALIDSKPSIERFEKKTYSGPKEGYNLGNEDISGIYALAAGKTHKDDKEEKQYTNLLSFNYPNKDIIVIKPYSDNNKQEKKLHMKGFKSLEPNYDTNIITDDELNDEKQKLLLELPFYNFMLNIEEWCLDNKFDIDTCKQIGDILMKYYENLNLLQKRNHINMKDDIINLILKDENIKYIWEHEEFASKYFPSWFDNMMREYARLEFLSYHYVKIDTEQ